MNRDSLIRIIKGDFNSRELKLYCLLQFLILLIFIVIAMALYPVENDFSIMRDTFSYLGSPNDNHNPNGWYFFSIGLFIVSITIFPLLFYRHRRLVKIAPWEARFTTLLMLIGAIGIFGVGLFPDSGQDFIEDLSYGKMHNTMALIFFIGDGLGLIFDGLLIYTKDRFPKWPGGKGGHQIANHKIIAPTYIIFITIALAMGICLIGWEIYYPILHAQDPSIGHWPGEGIFSFPMWEWIVIVSLFPTFYSTLLGLPNQIPNNNK